MEYLNYGLIAFGCLGLIGMIFANAIVSDRESSGVATAKSASLMAEINAQGAKSLSESNMASMNQMNERIKSLTIQAEEQDRKYSKLYDEVGPLIVLKEKMQTLTDKYNSLNERISKLKTVIRIEEKPAQVLPSNGKGMGALLSPKGKKSKEATQ